MGGAGRVVLLAMVAWTVPAAGSAQGTAGHGDAQAHAQAQGDDSASRALIGIVVDADAGTPVTGAEVGVVGTALSTLTGVDGRWRLSGVPAGPGALEVTHIGYGTVRVEVEGAAGPVRIALTPRAIPLGAVVVTGSRREQRLADVAVTTELVGRAALARTGASDVASVLTEQTGVQLQGGHPSGAGVMLQGLDAERVLVLVDGQPYVGRLSGTVDLSRIPAAMVERIEIVKGPQSTLYGSEAMGGVVNVITRSPAAAGWRVGAGATAGSEGRLDGHMEATGRIGDVAVLANAGHRRVELMPGRSSPTGALAARWDGLAKAGWSPGGPGGSSSVAASLMVVEEDQRWRTGPLWQFADNRQWSARLEGAWRLGAHSLAPAFHATTFDHLSRQGTSDAPPPVAAGDRQVQSLQELELVYGFAGARVDARVDVDAGVELTRESLDSESLNGRSRERLAAAPYLQATTSLGPVTLVPGVRASWHDAWGTHWTPRLAAMWRPVPSLAVRASAGQGYRAPSFKELHMEFLNVGPGYSYLVRGNPSLSPETSMNVTAGIEWAGARGFFRAQAFRNVFDDFIETRIVRDSAGITMYTYENVARGRTEGVEAEVGVRVRGLRAEAGYALLETEDESTGWALLGRPERSGRLSLSQGLPFGITAGLTGTWTGETPMERGEGETRWRDAYLRFDGRLSAEVANGVRISAGVDNVMDEVPAGWPGFAGRQIYLTAAVETGGGR